MMKHPTMLLASLLWPLACAWILPPTTTTPSTTTTALFLGQGSRPGGRRRQMNSYYDKHGRVEEEEVVVAPTRRQEDPNVMSRRDLGKSFFLSGLGSAAAALGYERWRQAALVPSSWETLVLPPSASASELGLAVPTPLCDQAVSYLVNKNSGQEVWLVGTAHISNVSAQLVRQTIRSVRPQTVMLELDAKRVGSVARTNTTTTTSTSSSSSSGSTATTSPPPQKPFGKEGFLRSAVREVSQGVSFRDRLVGLGAAVLGKVISGLYKTLDRMGFVSGQEFMVAIQEARAINADILLGDRDVQVTLRRLSEALSKADLSKLATVQAPPPGAPQVNIQDLEDPKQLTLAVEALKERATVRELMGTLKEELPEVYQAMIGERDEYMARSLGESGSPSIVAVVGIGHLDGIESYLQSRYGFRYDKTRRGVCAPK